MYKQCKRMITNAKPAGSYNTHVCLKNGLYTYKNCLIVQIEVEWFFTLSFESVLSLCDVCLILL